MDIVRTERVTGHLAGLLSRTVAALLAACVTASSSWAGWTFDPAAKTVTDGNWILSATISKNGGLEITGKKSVVTPTTLDLREAAVDAEGTAYPFESINGFEGTAGLVTVYFPDTLQNIMKAAFRLCPDLETVTPFLPEGLVALGGKAFSGCKKLAGDVVFPPNTIAIDNSWDGGQNGFFRETAITSADLSAATFTIIPNDSFRSCPNLRWVKLPNGIREIGGMVFHNCPELTSVTPFLPSTVSYLGAAAFYQCPKLTGDLVIDHPGKVTLSRHGNNGYGIFQGSSITSATITSPADNLSGNMFANCKKLERVVLPEKLGTISFSGDFQNCTALKSVTPLLPENLKMIATTTFYNCPELTGDVVIGGTNETAIGGNYWQGSRIFSFSKIESVKITAPATAVGNLSNGGTFQDMKKLHTVTFPPTLELAGPRLFSGCSSLTNVVFTGPCPHVIHDKFFLNGPTDQTRVYVPRFDVTWEHFVETNAANIVPLDDALVEKYRAKYPTGSLPIGRWTISGRNVWLCDKIYDGDNALYIRGRPYDAGDPEPGYGMMILEAGKTITCTAPETTTYEGSFYRCMGSILETETADHVWGNPLREEGATRVITQVGAETRRLTWIWEENAFHLDATVYGGGQGEVLLDPPAPIADNTYLPDTEVALTARPAEGYVFKRWVGDIPEEKSTDQTVVLVMDQGKSCRPIYSRAWTYDPEAKTITDGNWLLDVTASQTTNLFVTAVRSAAAHEALDLAMPIVDKEGAPCRLLCVDGFAGDELLTHLYLPDTLVELGKTAFNSCLSLAFVSPLLPSALETIGDRTFGACYQLAGDVVFPAHAIDFPKIGNSSLPNGTFHATRVTSIDMSKATIREIPSDFARDCRKLVSVKLPVGLESVGGLAFWRCESLTTITPFLPPTLHEFGQAAFYYCEKLGGDLVIEGDKPTVFSWHGNNGYGIFEGTALASATLRVPTDNLSGGMFRACTNLVSVTFGEDFGGFYRGQDFANCPALESVYFEGDCPADFPANTFYRTPSWKARLFVPNARPGWEAFLVENQVTKPTEEELAKYAETYPGEKKHPFGVLKLGGEYGTHWMVRWSTPRDKLRSTMLLLR